ncbi:MAG TPA: hypothetical protein VK123_09770 [Candidatus Limnocylindrales bacterium]|nr:hypothetical protein [Candidatus Limnocylindrales bacterium]
MRSASLLLVVAILAMVSCGKDRIPLKPANRTGPDFVFWSTRTNGLADLFAMNSDGTGLHQLTSDTLEDREPRWSPDGTKIVYVHRYDPNSDSADVTVMSADGTNRIRLTRDYADANPTWSPDGHKIAYLHDPAYVTNQLWVMNADGTSPQLLIDSDSLNGVNQITWTSQNTFLGADWFGLVKFNADGTGRTRVLSLTNVLYAYPRPSPDGTKIVFAWAGPLPASGSDIYTISADGTNLRQLTTSGGATLPVWSPDGTRIGYIGDDFGMWTMNVDGTNKVRVPVSSPSPGGDYLGDWR